MLKKVLLVLVVVALAIPLAAPSAAQEEKPKIGFLPGVVDPFYQVMELGVNAAVADFGLEVVTQYPEDWNLTLQTPILEAYIARGDLDYIITAPVDKEAMVAPLQAAVDAGIKVITVDTYLGDGDYANGPVTFPLTYIGSENKQGGRIAGEFLAEKLGGAGKVYVQNTNPGVSTTEERGAGFIEAVAEFPGMEMIGMDYNLDDANKSAEQVAAVLQREPELAGIFGVNVFSAIGAGNAVNNAGLSGAVDVIAFDATIFAIEQLRAGTVSLVIAQKPYDMGYMAVAFAMADWNGVTSIPKRVPTGFAVITMDNVDDPEVARFIYQVP
ncbi:MAG: substrate-binding domain-containing protein [Chloroflexi bacterium]|nr:substrate-binding domain-containing protein [Chloroflexota bacterium]